MQGDQPSFRLLSQTMMETGAGDTPDDAMFSEQLAQVKQMFDRKPDQSFALEVSPVELEWNEAQVQKNLLKQGMWNLKGCEQI